MREIGVVLSTAMVLARLAGRKTQMRRLIHLPHMNPLGQWEPSTFGGPNGGRTRDGKTVPLQATILHTRTGDSLGCPYGMVGDRIWWREAWRVSAKHDKTPPRYIKPRGMTVFYEACGSAGNEGDPAVWTQDEWPNQSDQIPEWVGRYRHAVSMPRWACRLVDEITDVRVQRLQEISDEDALAEGVDRTNTSIPGYAKERFSVLWESINGAGSWDANPWVWALSFKPAGTP